MKRDLNFIFSFFSFTGSVNPNPNSIDGTTGAININNNGVTIDQEEQPATESTYSIFSSLQSGPFSPLAPGEPFFDATIPRNVTALVGKTAYLTCRVRSLGNRTVSLQKQLHFEKKP